MGLVQTVAPAAEPVTVTEAKKQVEVLASSTEHDAHLTRLIKSERQFVERYTRRALITQTWKLTLELFPIRDIELPRPPLQSVTSVKYYDTQGNQQTLVNGVNYRVDTSRSPGIVYHIDGGWPAVDTDRRDAVEIIFVAGFGDAEDVPDGYREIILDLVAHKFENRGDRDTHQTFRLPRHMTTLLNSLRSGTSHGYFQGQI